MYVCYNVCYNVCYVCAYHNGMRVCVSPSTCPAPPQLYAARFFSFLERIIVHEPGDVYVYGGGAPSVSASISSAAVPSASLLDVVVVGVVAPVVVGVVERGSQAG